MAKKDRRVRDLSGRTGQERRKKFVTYGGYIPELDMILNDGYYLRLYEPGATGGDRSIGQDRMADPDRMVGPDGHGSVGRSVDGGAEDSPTPPGVLPRPGQSMQLIASKSGVYQLFGVRAKSPEEAVGKFREMEESYPYPAVPCSRWLGLLSERLLWEPFPGIPEGERADKVARISLIQPYGVRVRQKEMELSGKTVRTVLLMGYPSRLSPAFGSELLDLPVDLTLVVHAKGIDPALCMEGLALSTDIPPARRAAMEKLLGQAMEGRTRLYEVCALISIAGLPGEVEEACRVLEALCRKYLLSVSGLDHQQADAYQSTLPLSRNDIHYGRVLTEGDLKALLPWSELKICKRHVYYGEDIMNGGVEYDRRIRRDDGLILSGDHRWAMEQARKEIIAYLCTPGTGCGPAGAGIHILAGPDTDPSIFGSGKVEEEAIGYAQAPDWLLKAALIRWALDGLSTDGRTMERHITMVMGAAARTFDRKDRDDDRTEGGDGRELAPGGPHDGSDLGRAPASGGEGAGQGGEGAGDDRIGGAIRAGRTDPKDCVERFLSGLGEDERRALSLRPFPSSCSYRRIHTRSGEILQVSDKGVRAELCYALLFHSLHGIVYSLDTELLAWDMARMYRLHGDTMYTFLARDIRAFYRSGCSLELIQTSPFLLAGEHKILEKLHLAKAAGFDKAQRSWISEPAKGAVLMTGLASYLLKGESMSISSHDSGTDDGVEDGEPRSIDGEDYDKSGDRMGDREDSDRSDGQAVGDADGGSCDRTGSQERAHTEQDRATGMREEDIDG